MASVSSDQEPPALTVTMREGVTAVLVGVGVAYWLGSSAVPFLTALLGRWSTWPLISLSCLVGLGLAIWYASFSVRVGRDGIYLGRWRARRFIPATEIVSVQERLAIRTRHDGTRDIEGLDLMLRAQGSVHISLRKRGEQAARIKDRIERLIHESRGDSSLHLDQLSRRGKSLAAWKQDLALLAKNGGFRASTTSFDDLDAVLSDPTASLEHRLAAALALRSRADTHASARIRVAAEASAHPKVRVALAELATGDDADAAIEAALAEESSRAGALNPR